MVAITYIVVLPVAEDMSFFQGWHREVMGAEVQDLLVAATVSPIDTAEIFMTQQSLIDYRKISGGRRIRVIGGHLISSIPSLVETHFAIVLYPIRYAEKVSSLVFPPEIVTVFATTGDIKGAINLSSLKNRFSTQVLDYVIYKGLRSMRASLGMNEKMPKLRGAYSGSIDLVYHGAGVTIANELLLASLGYSIPDTDYIMPFDVEYYYNAIANGVESVLNILKSDDRKGVILYSPAIVNELYNTNSHRWNQLFRMIKRVQHRNFIKNALIKNPGYSGWLAPEAQTIDDHPYKDPMSAYLIEERQKELKVTNYTIGLLASSLGIPAIRLPNSVNLQISKLKEIDSIHAGKQISGNIRLGEKFKALVGELNSAYSERFRNVLKDRVSECIICSDVPLEWTTLEDLPLMISHEVCRVPMTPGNMLLQLCALGGGHELPVASVRDILVIRSFGRLDHLGGLLQEAVESFPLSKDMSVKFVDVNSISEVVAALNNFSGGVVIFDCHGNHEGITGTGWLAIGNEKLDSWRLHSVARIPPIVALSACSTSSIGGSYVSVANGFMRCGALSVIGTYLPVDGRHSSVFMARILFMVDKFLSELQEKRYQAINWRLLISRFFRMSYATDVLMHFEDKNFISEEQLCSIHIEVSGMITDFGGDWYNFLIDKVAEISTLSSSSLKTEVRENLPLTETMLYCHLGRPDLLNIIL